MKITFSIAFALLFAFACAKKESDGPDPIGSTQCFPVERSDSGSSGYYSKYLYDTHKRLVDFRNFSPGGDSTKITWSYSSNKVTMKIGPAITTVYDLNSLGLATRSVSSGPTLYYETPGNAKDTAWYWYNADKQLVASERRSVSREAGSNKVNFASVQKETGTFSNGRLASIYNLFVTTDSSGHVTRDSSETIFTYNNASPVVKFNPVIFFGNYGPVPFFGSLVSNQIPTQVALKRNDAFEVGPTVYQTEYNANNNPIKIRKQSVVGLSTDLYIYSCP